MKTTEDMIEVMKAFEAEVENIRDVICNVYAVPRDLLFNDVP